MNVFFPVLASRRTTAQGCRFCGATLERTFADLGMQPLANAYVRPDDVNKMEPFYPLRALICDQCFLVQAEDFESPSAIFSDYLYFSSFSSTWLDHARRYVERMTEWLGLDESSFVVELASNDGYLLQYFLERHIPILGIEPAANVAKVALRKGIPTLVEFFGRATAETLIPDSRADLLIGNNVLAHVPDINDFLAGAKMLLKESGVVTMEFPHLLRLLEDIQFDTIYHEHFSYFSFGTASRIFAEHGIRLFDVEELSTQGGSIRIYGCHDDANGRPVSARVHEILQREDAAGLTSVERYEEFAREVERIKRDILGFLIDLKGRGQRVVGYGAPAKGNTLLNYCGISTDFIDFTVDVSPHKQGCYLPGSHIPVLAPSAIGEAKPDVIFILPWNLREEIMEQLSFVRDWGAVFAARAPEITLFA